jgi:hypothetical protein
MQVESPSLFCGHCGYDVRHLETRTQCPECGASLDDAVANRGMIRRRKRLIFWAKATMVCSIAFVISAFLSGWRAPGVLQYRLSDIAASLVPLWMLMVGNVMLSAWQLPRDPSVNRRARRFAWYCAGISTFLIALPFVIYC